MDEFLSIKMPTSRECTQCKVIKCLNLYHAEIYFFPISCATEVFFAKKSLFHHFSGFKKHYVAFFQKKLILALGD